MRLVIMLTSPVDSNLIPIHDSFLIKALLGFPGLYADLNGSQILPDLHMFTTVIISCLAMFFIK